MRGRLLMSSVEDKDVEEEVKVEEEEDEEVLHTRAHIRGVRMM